MVSRTTNDFGRPSRNSSWSEQNFTVHISSFLLWSHFRTHSRLPLFSLQNFTEDTQHKTWKYPSFILYENIHTLGPPFDVFKLSVTNRQIITNTPSLLTIEQWCLHWHEFSYYAIQNRFGAGVEENWPSNAFSLRKAGLRSTYRRSQFWQKKKKIIFSDQDHFDLGGCVSKQNCCIWGSENSHTIIESRRTQNKSLRILVQRHNWTIFLRKCARSGYR